MSRDLEANTVVEEEVKVARQPELVFFILLVALCNLVGLCFSVVSLNQIHELSTLVSFVMHAFAFVCAMVVFLRFYCCGAHV